MPEDWIRLLTLSDYNTRVVMLGCMALGVAAGMIGPFMVLRRRALMADAVSHASLPGICMAFLVLTGLGFSGKSLAWLLLGALVSGLLGMLCVLGIQQATRLKQDAALGIVLSVFYGFGIALLGVIQDMKTGHAAGLKDFIYGKTASMLAQDAWLMGGCALLVIMLTLALFKEFKLLCFDPDYMDAEGGAVGFLDAFLMGLVVVVTVVGLQAVGLMLMIALLIIPPVTARFWTHNLAKLLVISGAVGAISCVLGVVFSALYPRTPPGSLIVLAGFGLFLASMLVGPHHGLIHSLWEQRRHRKLVRREHVLRELYEHSERAGNDQGMEFRALRTSRTWTPSALQRILKSLEHEGIIRFAAGYRILLTKAGQSLASRVVRRHRLWELYLIHYADIAPSHVDRDADEIEHVLSPEVVDRLEDLLDAQKADHLVPASPHDLVPGVGAPSVHGGLR